MTGAGVLDFLIARLSLRSRRLGVSKIRRRVPGGGESGQALVLALGACFVLIAAALALVAIAGAVTGKGRAQRAADLAAISAARSMRDEISDLLSPPLLPNGEPNPAHIAKSTYLDRAREAALTAARRNEVDPARLRIVFPDQASFAPVRAKATVVGELDVGSGAPREVEASAEAEAAAPVTGGSGGGPAMASGGGYSGPLVYRDGEGMRPDVAAAYDQMAAAAAADGITLIVVSGFRSDAEQAELFAAHPDPKWVAPPGTSLHRCATELDLGPDVAYGWLASNAGRFGFVQRYSCPSADNAQGVTAARPDRCRVGRSGAAAGPDARPLEAENARRPSRAFPDPSDPSFPTGARAQNDGVLKTDRHSLDHTDLVSVGLAGRFRAGGPGCDHDHAPHHQRDSRNRANGPRAARSNMPSLS